MLTERLDMQSHSAHCWVPVGLDSSLPSPRPFVLKPLYGVYTVLIGHEICRSALWAVFTLWSLLYQYTSVCIYSSQEVKFLMRESEEDEAPYRGF